MYGVMVCKAGHAQFVEYELETNRFPSSDKIVFNDIRCHVPFTAGDGIWEECRGGPKEYHWQESGKWKNTNVPSDFEHRSFFIPLPNKDY